MLNEVISQSGDWIQIKELSKIWKDLFEVKEHFIYQASRTNLTAGQRAEVELTLAKITGEMKETDALIHFLMFGTGDLTSRVPALSLQTLFDMQKNGEARITVKQVIEENKRLISENVDMSRALKRRGWTKRGRLRSIL